MRGTRSHLRLTSKNPQAAGSRGRESQRWKRCSGDSGALRYTRQSG